MLGGQDEGSLMKAKEHERFILCFPAAGDVRPFPGKQGFTTRGRRSGGQMP